MVSIIAKVPSASTTRPSRLVREVAFSHSQGRWQPVFQHHVPHQLRRLTRAQSKRATEEDERLIEEMKRAAEKGDVLESGAADVLIKVLAVSVAIGVVVVLAYLAQPVIENTVEVFPTAL